MKLFSNVDLYSIKDKFLVVDGSRLYLVDADKNVTEFKLPINITGMQINVDVNNRLLVWGDDGISNSFYIGEIDNKDWERIVTKKKVENIVSDYKSNLFIILNDGVGLVYKALIGKKFYTWKPPRSTPASISLSDKSNTKSTIIQIEQSDSLPIQVTKELKQTCRVDFVFCSEFKGIKNNEVEFAHLVSKVKVVAENFENVELSPVEFKQLLSGAKSLQDIRPLQYKTISYEEYRVERPTATPQPQIGGVDLSLLDSDAVGNVPIDNISGKDIITPSNKVPELANNPYR